MKFFNKDVKAVETINDLKRFLSDTLGQVSTILNGKIIFSDNFEQKTTSVTISTANTDFEIQHGLNRAPVGYILVKASVAMSIYDGAGGSNNNSIFLRSSAAGTATIMVF